MFIEQGGTNRGTFGPLLINGLKWTCFIFTVIYRERGSLEEVGVSEPGLEQHWSHWKPWRFVDRVGLWRQCNNSTHHKTIYLFFEVSFLVSTWFIFIFNYFNACFKERYFNICVIYQMRIKKESFLKIDCCELSLSTLTIYIKVNICKIRPDLQIGRLWIKIMI